MTYRIHRDAFLKSFSSLSVLLALACAPTFAWQPSSTPDPYSSDSAMETAEEPLPKRKKTARFGRTQKQTDDVRPQQRFPVAPEALAEGRARLREPANIGQQKDFYADTSNSDANTMFSELDHTPAWRSRMQMWKNRDKSRDHDAARLVAPSNSPLSASLTFLKDAQNYFGTAHDLRYYTDLIKALTSETPLSPSDLSDQCRTSRNNKAHCENFLQKLESLKQAVSAQTPEAFGIQQDLYQTFLAEIGSPIGRPGRNFDDLHQNFQQFLGTLLNLSNIGASKDMALLAHQPIADFALTLSRLPVFNRSFYDGMLKQARPLIKKNPNILFVLFALGHHPTFLNEFKGAVTHTLISGEAASRYTNPAQMDWVSNDGFYLLTAIQRGLFSSHDVSKDDVHTAKAAIAQCRQASTATFSRLSHADYFQYYEHLLERIKKEDSSFGFQFLILAEGITSLNKQEGKLHGWHSGARIDENRITQMHDEFNKLMSKVLRKMITMDIAKTPLPTPGWKISSRIRPLSPTTETPATGLSSEQNARRLHDALGTRTHPLERRKRYTSADSAIQRDDHLNQNRSSQSAASKPNTLFTSGTNPLNVSKNRSGHWNKQMRKAQDEMGTKDPRNYDPDSPDLDYGSVYNRQQMDTDDTFTGKNPLAKTE